MAIININKILTILPHRYPFILVDRVLDYQINQEREEDNRLVAIKNVSINEPYFAGHFPGNPVMPGVLMLEAIAQACVLLSCLINPNEPVVHFFAGVDKARFKRKVLPGDQLQLEVNIKSRKRNLSCMFGQAKVDGELACSANLMSAAVEQLDD